MGLLKLLELKQIHSWKWRSGQKNIFLYKKRREAKRFSPFFIAGCFL